MLPFISIRNEEFIEWIYLNLLLVHEQGRCYLLGEGAAEAALTLAELVGEAVSDVDGVVVTTVAAAVGAEVEIVVEREPRDG